MEARGQAAAKPFYLGLTQANPVGTLCTNPGWKEATAQLQYGEEVQWYIMVGARESDGGAGFGTATVRVDG